MNDKNPPSHPSTESASQPHRGKFNFWRWFWLGTIPVSAVWVWFDFYVPSNNVAWAKDYAAAQRQAAQSGRPMVLFFTGEWCVPCRIMKRRVWADRQVEEVIGKGFTPVMIDVDDPDAAATLSRFRVGPTPVTIVADPQGVVLKRADGGLSKAEFLDLVGIPSPDGGMVPAPSTNSF